MPRTTVWIVLVFVLCIFATVMIRDDLAVQPGVGGRVAIALVWVAGVALMIWMLARKSR